jgi:hypothetical protein
MTRGEMLMIEKYRNPLLFYSLATVIPWAFWFAAGYVSHLIPYSDQNLKIASILGFAGLLGPLGVTIWLACRDSALRRDILGRIINFRSFRPGYLLISCFLMLKDKDFFFKRELSIIDSA